ncbi:MAG: protein kinase [Polyangiaceae bacterium]|nr:protein kinase [Polyangiaceae bacterium]
MEDHLEDAAGSSPPASQVHAASLITGEIVAGKYRVEKFIDAGGMAQIFVATNLELDERVALKLPHPTFRDRPDLNDRFREEARSLARVRSENVARVHDVVSTAENEPVMVMEFLEGENLARLIEKKALPSFEERIGWMIETCSGVAVAHANGIVHRDVKPENIFIAVLLGGRRMAKVLDFGISRLAMTTSRRRGLPSKVADHLVGSPMYMAPEQIASPNAADPRVDVWSIGVVLFELFAGRPPFIGKTVDEVCERILHTQAENLTTFVPNLDPELTLIVDKCLQRDPELRFGSVADLAVALLPFGPPRLATTVDHTINVLRAAGMTEVEMPATISLLPNTPENASFRDSRPSSSNRSIKMSSRPTPLPATVSRRSDLSQLTSTQASPEKPAPSRRRTFLVVALLAILAAMIGLVLLWQKPTPLPEAVAQPSASTRVETSPPSALAPATPSAVPSAGVVSSAAPTMSNAALNSTSTPARPKTGAPAANSGAPATKPSVRIIDDSPSKTKVIE